MQHNKVQLLTSWVPFSFGGAQPRKEAFVVVREEDGLGDLGDLSKEKHTQTQKMVANRGLLEVGVLNKCTHVSK